MENNSVGYAYLDEHGIMHIVSMEKDAKEYAKLSGKIKKYNGEFKGGYPVHNGKEVIVKIKNGAVSAVMVNYKGDLPLTGDAGTAFAELAKELV